MENMTKNDDMVVVTGAEKGLCDRVAQVLTSAGIPVSLEPSGSSNSYLNPQPQKTSSAEALVVCGNGQSDAEVKLRQLSQAVEQSPVSVVVTDIRGAITYVNPQFCKLTGYAFEEVVGRNPRILKSGSQDTMYYTSMWKTIASGDIWHGEFHNFKKNGESYWEQASISPIRDAHGRITHYVAVKEDISARKKIEAEREQLITELQAALHKVKTLSGLLPICSGCKKIRTDGGYWQHVETYISSHTNAQFSHGLCPECMKKYFAGYV
jgi:PAS domain S-box-containing protein